MSSINTLGFVIPTLSLGGAERVVARLAAGLSADFHCYILIRRGGVCQYPVEGVEIVETDYTADGFRATVARLGIDLLLDHFHWDAQHVQLMAQLAREGMPIVLTEHNAYHYPLFQAAQDRRPGYENYFAERYEHYRHFAGVTLLNQDAYDAFAAHLDNLRVIANPVSYAPDGVCDPWSNTVLNVSHYGKPAKRIDLLYGAWTHVRKSRPDARLRIVGEYLYVQDQYYRRISGLGDAPVQAVGRSRHVSHHYNQSAVFALSSSIEGQPMVLLEAAMHAMPSVSFDLPGLRAQVIDGETGLLVPFGDTAAFGDALCSLLAQPKRIAEMGRAARSFVMQEFDLEKTLGVWRGLINDIATQGRIHSTLCEPAPEVTQRNEHWQKYWLGIHRGELLPTPKVSFLVPVYGTEEVLGRCLRTLQEQTLREFECLIVDDASPGDVAGVVRDTVGDDGRFRVIHHETNRGLYQARSTAAEQARGLYFANIDSDDYVHPRFAEKLFREAVTTGANIVECRAIELTEEGRPIRFNSHTAPRVADGRDMTAAYFNGSLRNVVWNKLYDRDLWWASRDHNEIDCGLTITEDTLRNTYLFPRARRYAMLEDCLYFYCRRGTSVVKGGDLSRLMAKLKDISTSYTLSRQHARELGDPHALKRLEHRRCEDVAWYVNEFVGRHGLERVIGDLLATPFGSADEMLTLVYLCSGLAQYKAESSEKRRAWLWEQNRANEFKAGLDAARKDLAERRNAWQWEQSRADGLQKKLDAIRDTIFR